MRPVTRIMVLLLAFVGATPASAAWADAAGPTDYRTRVVSIEPATPTVHPSIVGGDSFLLLRVDRGTEVQVLGYRSEPYLRFLPDGTVQENRSSASYYVSRSRLGEALPAGFVDDAPPDWHTVASDGTYAWHDHRTHWMTDGRPPGKQPGDVVLQQTVPLVVDGVEVAVVVQSVWMEAPSSLAVWVGGFAGVTIGVVLARGRRWVALLPVVDLAVLAAVVGAWQYRSLPAETGPRTVWWLLPAIAVAAAVAAIVARRRRTELVANALLLLAGCNLLVWGWLRRGEFDAAILATDAPGWLDRAVSAAALCGGAATTMVGLWALLRVIVRPASAPTTAATSATS